MDKPQKTLRIGPILEPPHKKTFSPLLLFLVNPSFSPFNSLWGFWRLGTKTGGTRIFVPKRTGGVCPALIGNLGFFKGTHPTLFWSPFFKGVKFPLPRGNQKWPFFSHQGGSPENENCFPAYFPPETFGIFRGPTGGSFREEDPRTKGGAK